MLNLSMHNRYNDNYEGSIEHEGIMINVDLVNILACPQCKGAVKLRGEEELVCEKCRLVYEIKDDIPIMLIDEATKLN